MALVLPDAVINTSGLFQDLHENVTDLVSKGRQDIFAYRSTIFSAEKFFGNNLKLTSDIRDSFKLQDINSNVAARDCRTSPEGIIVVSSSVCILLEQFITIRIFLKSVSKNVRLFIIFIHMNIDFAAPKMLARSGFDRKRAIGKRRRNNTKN